MQPPEDCVPLQLHMEGCATEAEMNANVEASLVRGYTRINEYIGGFSGTVSICGSGPSLARSYRDIRGDVFAINSAIGFMIDHGAPPRWAMIWDASPLCEAFAVPSPHTTYLIGARCHPSVFERLAGCRVISWHAGGDHNISEFLSRNGIAEPLVNGGSAGVTRALYMVYALGYRSIHIHGADSSYSEAGETHVRGSLVPEKSIRVFFGGRWWHTTPEWCAQIEEFKNIWPFFHSEPYGARIKVHGEGMLPYAATLLERAYAIPAQNHSQPLEVTQ